MLDTITQHTDFLGFASLEVKFQLGNLEKRKNIVCLYFITVIDRRQELDKRWIFLLCGT